MALGSSLLQATGRMLTAPIFIVGGYSSLTQPGGRVQAAKPLLDAMREYVPILPEDDELLVRVNGGVQLAAGTALFLGIKPRLSALALAASLVPTTVAGHAFWEKEGAEAAAQRTQFSKNMAALGGLLLVAGAGAGRKAAKKAARKAVTKGGRQK